MDFFGGEPLMNWEVVKQLVAYGREQEKLHDKRFRFTLTTNGVLLNDEVMEFCNREMGNVVLSIDGRKEVHDRMRPFRKGAGSYDLIVPKFQKFAESRHQQNYYVQRDLHPLQPGFCQGRAASGGSGISSRSPWSRWWPRPRRITPSAGRTFR